MKIKAARFANDEAGTAAVEFALVLPIFLTILLGILAYGVYFGASQSAAQLAGDAARASVAGLTDVERASIARSHIAAHASNYMMLNASKVSVDAAPAANDPHEFRVVVRYDASTLPIWNFAPFLPLPEKTIEQAAVIRRGGY